MTNLPTISKSPASQLQVLLNIVNWYIEKVNVREAFLSETEFECTGPFKILSVTRQINCLQQGLKDYILLAVQFLNADDTKTVLKFLSKDGKKFTPYKYSILTEPPKEQRLRHPVEYDIYAVILFHLDRDLVAGKRLNPDIRQTIKSLVEESERILNTVQLIKTDKIPINRSILYLTPPI